MTYQMLSGHLPFDSDDYNVLRSAVVNEAPEPVDGLSPAANECLLKALSKDPKLRFASCTEFANELERALNGSVGGENDVRTPAPPPVPPAVATPIPVPPTPPPPVQNGQSAPVKGEKHGKGVWFAFVLLLLGCIISYGIYQFRQIEQTDTDRAERKTSSRKHASERTSSLPDDTEPETDEAVADAAQETAEEAAATVGETGTDLNLQIMRDYENAKAAAKLARNNGAGYNDAIKSLEKFQSSDKIDHRERMSLISGLRTESEKAVDDLMGTLDEKAEKFIAAGDWDKAIETYRNGAGRLEPESRENREQRILNVERMRRKAAEAAKNLQTQPVRETTRPGGTATAQQQKTQEQEQEQTRPQETASRTQEQTTTIRPVSATQGKTNVSAGPAEQIIALADGVEMKLLKIEAGTFEMSAKDGENYPEEVPHQVTLTQDFYLARTEVTQAQWKAVMGTDPADHKGDNLPVEKVSWHDAMEFCMKLNEMGKAPGGWMFTLPTETQWEYAARGGNKSKGYKFSGSNDLGEVAWCWDNSSSKTHPVGQKSPNELGLCDMSGNVYEWCLDDWNSDSSKLTAEFTRGNDQNKSSRALRGGRWGNLSRFCRSAYRGNDSPTVHDKNLGFRPALVPASVL